jgi:lipid-binding SYLF domain-containing protein
MNMKSAIWFVPVVVFAALALVGCSTEPKSAEGKANLHDDVVATLNKFERADTSMHDLLNNRAYGYAVFPKIGKGGAIVGGAYGKGEVYEQGKVVGYCDMTQASVGLQLGGQSYSELLVFSTKEAFDRFKSGNFSLSANVSAVAATAGAAGAAKFENGVAIFITGEAGLMGELSVGGQKFSFRPLEGTTPAPTEKTTIPPADNRNMNSNPPPSAL